MKKMMIVVMVMVMAMAMVVMVMMMTMMIVMMMMIYEGCQGNRIRTGLVCNVMLRFSQESFSDVAIKDKVG